MGLYRFRSPARPKATTRWVQRRVSSPSPSPWYFAVLLRIDEPRRGSHSGRQEVCGGSGRTRCCRVITCRLRPCNRRTGPSRTDSWSWSWSSETAPPARLVGPVLGELARRTPLTVESQDDPVFPTEVSGVVDDSAGGVLPPRPGHRPDPAAGRKRRRSGPPRRLAARAVGGADRDRGARG